MTIKINIPRKSNDLRSGEKKTFFSKKIPLLFFFFFCDLTKHFFSISNMIFLIKTKSNQNKYS